MKIKYPELFEEFIENGYDLKQIERYVEFIEECKEKNYDGCAIHKHHIIPKFMGGTNRKSNLIRLSPEDHYNSHIILSNCYNSGIPEYFKNIGSARQVINNARIYLEKWYPSGIPDDISKFWDVANKLLEGLNSGENNPMYGKTHSVETRQKLSEHNIGKSGHNLGKKFGPLSEKRKKEISVQFKGKPKSEETKFKMKLYHQKKRIMLPGVFYYFNFPEYDSKKAYHRICTCGELMFYCKLQYANDAEKNQVLCRSCRRTGKSSSLKGKKIGPRKFKIKQPNKKCDGGYNPNSYRIYDTRSSLEYSCMNDAAVKLNIGKTRLSTLIKKGILLKYRKDQFPYAIIEKL